MKSTFLSCLAFLALFASPTVAAVQIVQMVPGPLGSFDFQPRIVYIARGDTVRWVNNTTETHTATGGIRPTPDGSSPIQSPFLGSGGTYQASFPNMGFFRYFCQVHPDMTGMVRVGRANVSIFNFTFIPAALTVGVGDTVIWKNNTTFTHTSTSGSPAGTPNGIWDSGFLGSGDSFQYSPAAAGNFPYFCNVHNFMTGTLTVNAGQLAGVDGSSGLRTRLLAARPNPARREVTLGFELSKAGPARLTLSDASGRAVATLLDARVEAGRHDVSWNGRTAAGQLAGAGVYYYRLRAGSFTQSRRFTWVR